MTDRTVTGKKTGIGEPVQGGQGAQGFGRERRHTRVLYTRRRILPQVPRAPAPGLFPE